MAPGFSTSPLAGEVARHGGIGTLPSATLYELSQYTYLRKDALEQAKKIQNPVPLEVKQEIFHQVNLECIIQEVKNAKFLSQGNGLIFMNFLHALTGFKDQVQAACKAGVDGVVSGAGIAWDLPAITKEYPDVALGIILSDPKGVKIVVEKRMKDYGRTPDFFVFEDPSVAAGHLGVKTLDKVYDSKYFLQNSLPLVRQWLNDNHCEHIALIGAGGIVDARDVRQVIGYGADGVQLGTRFLASEESQAHDKFKQAVVDSTADDIVTYMSSVGLPARALRQSPILTSMLGVIAEKKTCIYDCLRSCGWRDGNQSLAQMCIIKELIKSTTSGNGEGLMFVGKSASRIYDILSVEQIMKTLAA
ncbi:MAG: nitronate monooxygenase [candidate division SR1 bacterium]|nr:nitronate monooxygenase [candidate division SR1 bacterium]